MQKLSSLLILSLLFTPLINTGFADVEYEEFSVTAGQTRVLSYWMNEDDTISFTVYVSGGSGDDINFVMRSPSNNDLLDGLIQKEYSAVFVALETGNYKFEFDNSFSIFSSKNINFDYRIDEASRSSGGGDWSGILAILVIIGVVIGIVVWISLLIKTRKRNKAKNYESRIDSTNDEKIETPIEKEQDDKALSILKERLAKVEITKKEYDELKKEFT